MNHLSAFFGVGVVGERQGAQQLRDGASMGRGGEDVNAIDRLRLSIFSLALRGEPGGAAWAFLSVVVHFSQARPSTSESNLARREARSPAVFRL